jgi:hypothetical protein
MAVDSCAGLIAALPRPAEAGSAGLASAGSMTELADGTDVSAAPPAWVAGKACTPRGAGASGACWQAVSQTAIQQVAVARGVRMGFLSMSAGGLW